jgi:hypothetical protein
MVSIAMRVVVGTIWYTPLTYSVSLTGRPSCHSLLSSFLGRPHVSAQHGRSESENEEDHHNSSRKGRCEPTVPAPTLVGVGEENRHLSFCL